MERVVDTNVFIHGRGSYSFDTAYITPEVFEEVKTASARNALNNIDYKVLTPSKESLKIVKDKSDDLNSPTSPADEALLALACDKDQILLTDDKALQNLALHIDKEVEGFMDEPLREKFEWERVCTNCGFETGGSVCPKCGSDSFRRKQVRCSSE